MLDKGQAELPLLYSLQHLCFARLPLGCAAPAAEQISEPASDIYWSDGDSGRIDEMKFRLSDVDAPETGDVGSVGGAKCGAERGLGYDAKKFIVEFTRNADLEITATYGEDRYGRKVIDLSANSIDVGDAGTAEGHLWPHKGRRALQMKPDWCAAAQQR